MNQIVLIICFTLCTSASFAQDNKSTKDERHSNVEKIAQELADPNSPLASLNFKNTFVQYTGDLPDAKKQNSYSLLFRPAMPFLLENGDKIFFRPTIPFISKLPVFQNDGFNNKSGIGNISFDFTYAPKSTGSFIYSFGAAGSFPTATNDSLGSKKATLGPEYFVGKKTKKYIVGMFPNHQWDIAGPGDEDISRTSSQFFAVLFPGGGWSYGTAPTFTYDWVSKEWIVPISTTVNKTVILSGRPWRFGIELNYYVEQPDTFGPEWEISINISPVVENILAKWFK